MCFISEMKKIVSKSRKYLIKESHLLEGYLYIYTKNKKQFFICVTILIFDLANG